MAVAIIEQIRSDLKSKYPTDVCDAIINSYVNVKEQFYLAKEESLELHGGKFVEACTRLLQEEINKNHTPLGTHIPNIVKTLRDFENANCTVLESFRIHIPRALVTIYNIRNKRGVGHLGGDVNPNIADASLIVACCDWVLCELFRVFYTIPLDEAQKVVNFLVKRKVSLVFDLGYTSRVLHTGLGLREQTLLLLFSVTTNMMSDEQLLQALEYQNKYYYLNTLLPNLHKERFIEYSSNNVILLPKGVAYVDSHIQDWIEKYNTEVNNG